MFRVERALETRREGGRRPLLNEIALRFFSLLLFSFLFFSFFPLSFIRNKSKGGEQVGCGQCPLDDLTLKRKLRREEIMHEREWRRHFRKTFAWLMTSPENIIQGDKTAFYCPPPPSPNLLLCFAERVSNEGSSRVRSGSIFARIRPTLLLCISNST